MVVKLFFDELVQVVLPLTAWWKKYIVKKTSIDAKKESFREFINDDKNVISDLKALQKTETSISRLIYPPEWLWLVKIIGKICYSQTHKTDISKISDAKCFKIFSSLMSEKATLESKDEPLVWSVTRNRSAAIAVWRSTLAVKADAARLLFNTSCKDSLGRLLTAELMPRIRLSGFAT